MTLVHLTSHLNGFHLLNPLQSPRLLSLSRVSVSISHRTQLQSLVLCAKKRNKGVGYRRIITRFLFNSLSLLSPDLLPQPLDLVIADLGGVDGGGGGRGGGGLGFWRGWGRFDGWRRKRNRVPILVFVCVVLWVYGFCRVSGIEVKSELVLKVLGVCLFGVTMVKELKREARFLVFGFLLCFIASLVLGFKRESFVKLASRVRSCSSVLCNKRSRRRVYK
ncbi:hypothetical protein CARUB_v10001930mg [Capsella rubella]|uniref:Transmembrane protein n=1 Tax=Capsella rubella TaxID=81985 RepID=R0H9C1_9BRAS|nr:uncharacterized protein LOC17882327 [Capsella rubella]EOA21525.1 hypothetical protein CARUB_v10001930mg [Capsella rubella]